MSHFVHATRQLLYMYSEYYNENNDHKRGGGYS